MPFYAENHPTKAFLSKGGSTCSAKGDGNRHRLCYCGTAVPPEASDSSFQWFLDGGKLKHWEEGVKHSPASGGDKLWNWEEASLFCATEDSASPGTDARGPLGRLPMPLSAEENELIRQHAIKAKLGQGVQRNSGGALADQDYIWLGGYMLEGQTGLWGRKAPAATATL